MPGVNERIIRAIRENCGEDKELADFILELIYQEVENYGKSWWWKDTYKKLIKKYLGLYFQKR